MDQSFRPMLIDIDMNPLTIIKKYFEPGSIASDILIEHSRMVTAKALAVAEHVGHLFPDLAFIKEAAMLHDIGIVFVNEPQLGCYGKSPYVCHGYMGRELLEKEGLPLHGLVCERHIGTGIGIADIEQYNLQLPKRDMKPLTIEEKIICYADKFYSKRVGYIRHEKTEVEARGELEKFGAEQLRAFDEMHRLFSNISSQETGRMPEQ